MSHINPVGEKKIESKEQYCGKVRLLSNVLQYCVTP